MTFGGLILGGQSVVIRTIVISSNQNKWNLIADGFGGVAPTKRAIVTITVDAGVEITSDTIGVSAMDLTGLPDNSKITLTNNGEIYGRGGDGGKGEKAANFSDI